MDLATACPPSRQQLSDRRQLAAAGVTRGALQAAVVRGQLRAVRRGVYSPAPLPPVGKHLLSGGVVDAGYLARVRATLLALGPGCCAARRTAAVLWGFDLAVEPTGVEVDVPPGRTVREPGLFAVRRPVQVVVQRAVLGLDPVPVTPAVQTVVDCAVTLPLTEAVVVADSALRSGLVTKKALREAAGALRGQPGARAVRKVVRLADGRSGSVLESLLRVLLVLNGLPVPELQFTIRSEEGIFVGRVDLCWPELRLVVECDGRRWHDPADARDSDRRRDNSLEGLSWRLLRFTWAEVVHDPAYVLGLVRTCLAGWRAAA